MYDTYVSLGQNCEVAFQFRRVLGKDTSSFFSWNVTPLDSLISLLKSEFSGILQETNLTNFPDAYLLADSSHDFHVHSPFRTEVIRDDPEYVRKMDDLRSKFAYFVHKFKNDALTKDRICYFYTSDLLVGVRDKAMQVRDCLDKYHQKRNYSLVIVQPEQVAEDHWGERALFNRYVRRLAPWNEAHDAHVASWDKIFHEFPHTGPMYFAGY